LGTKVDMSETRECSHADVIKWADLEKGIKSPFLSEWIVKYFYGPFKWQSPFRKVAFSHA